MGLSAAAAVAAVLGVGWAGAHGDLPRPIQQVVASMARSVGIDVPDGTPPPVTGARRPAVAPVGAERDSGRAVRAGTPPGQGGGGTPPGQVDQDTPPGQGGTPPGRGR